jgi:hypothetical protein
LARFHYLYFITPVCVQNYEPDKVSVKDEPHNVPVSLAQFTNNFTKIKKYGGLIMLPLFFLPPMTMMSPSFSHMSSHIPHILAAISITSALPTATSHVVSPADATITLKRARSLSF